MATVMDAVGKSNARMARAALFEKLSTEEIIDFLSYQGEHPGQFEEEMMGHLFKMHPEYFEKRQEAQT
jgi:hypothetical protein